MKKQIIRIYKVYNLTQVFLLTQVDSQNTPHKI